MTRHGSAALCLLLAATAVHAGDFSRQAEGTTSAQFLDLPAGARAAALGSAQGAAAADASALHYNPACLAGIRGGSALLTHAGYIQGIGYQYGAAAQRLGGFGTLAVGVMSLSSPEIAELDNRGLATGKSFSPGDLSIAMGLGRELGRLDLGGGLKLISSEIRGSAQTWAVDFGARLRLGALALSGSVANLGAGLRFRERREPLPMVLRLGSSLRSGVWLIAADATFPRGSEPAFGAGIERLRTVSGLLTALRAGMDSRAVLGGLGGMAGLTFGGGIGNGGLSVDYAWSPLGFLGTAHRFSVSLAWDAPKAREPASGGAAADRPARRPQTVAPGIYTGEDHLRWLFMNLEENAVISISLSQGAKVSGKFRGFVRTRGSAGGRSGPPQAAREDVLLRPHDAGFLGEQSFTLEEINSVEVSGE